MNDARPTETPTNIGAALRRFFTGRNRIAPRGSLIVRWSAGRVKNAFDEITAVVAIS